MPRPLTDVPGIGPAAAALLSAAGIDSAEALAAATVAAISAVKTFGPLRAANVKAAAAALIGSDENQDKPAKAPKTDGKKTKKDKKKSSARKKAEKKKDGKKKAADKDKKKKKKK